MSRLKAFPQSTVSGTVFPRANCSIDESKKTLPLLTEFRGIAALLIFNLHFLWLLPALRSELGAITIALSRCYLAVDFFFILSGFILTHVYRDWFYPMGIANGFSNFLRARFGRIYPLHFIVSCLTLLAVFGISAQWKLPGFFSDVLLLNSFPRMPILNVPSWSISSEFIAYLFAPMLIRFMAGASWWKQSGLVLFAASGLCFFLFVRWETWDSHSVFRCLPEFVFGVFCYEVYLRRKIGLKPAFLLFATSILIIFASVSLLASKRVGDLICVGSFCILIYASVQLRGRWIRWFSFGFGYLGEISYSLYLIHSLLIIGVAQWIRHAYGLGLTRFGTEVMVYLMGTVSLIGIAALTHRWIELPGRAFFKKPSNSRRGGDFS